MAPPQSPFPPGPPPESERGEGVVAGPREPRPGTGGRPWPGSPAATGSSAASGSSAATGSPAASGSSGGPDLPDGEPSGEAGAGRTVTGLAPAWGVGAANDPGFLASLRGGTMLGQLRITMLALTIAPVLILAIVPFIVREGRSGFADVQPLLCLPPILGALVAAVVAPRAPRPMRPGQEPRRAAGAALMALRQAIFLRFGLCEGVIILGLPLSILGRSELPFLVGFVLAYPMLVLFTLPTTGLIERLRSRLEAGGAESHLWAVLLSRYSPPRAYSD